jgi:hypothetical protein
MFVLISHRFFAAPPLGPPRKRRAIKTRLLTSKALDGRTRARRQFDAIAKGIAADLGGEDLLSTVEQHLVDAFAGAAVHVHDLNARLLRGDKVDILAHSQAVSMMVRVASRIGLKRVARDITPRLDDIARDIAAERELDDVG